MHHDAIDNSPLGWGRIWIATILGTALCAATVAWFNALQGADGNALPAALIAAPALFLLAIAVRRGARRPCAERHRRLEPMA